MKNSEKKKENISHGAHMEYKDIIAKFCDLCEKHPPLG